MAAAQNMTTPLRLTVAASKVYALVTADVDATVRFEDAYESQFAGSTRYRYR
jgi:hypothetical protein